MESEKKINIRSVILFFLLLAFGGFLIVRLFNLTVTNGDYYYGLSSSKKTVSRVLTGNRGEILDRNGVVLAENTYSYSVQLNLQTLPSKSKDVNNVLLSFIHILDDMDEADTLLTDIPLKVRYVYSEATGKSEAEFYYTWENLSESAQASKMSAWYRDINVSKKVSANEIYSQLRKRYALSDDISHEDALRIISLRLNVYFYRYKKHLPITVAQDLSYEAILAVEAATDLDGIEVIIENMRHYPQKDVAGHILGYVGRISDNVDIYKKAGYDIDNDLVGKIGLEKAAEEYLTASTSDKKGYILGEIDSLGSITNIVEEVKPSDGYNVVSTIDSRLQSEVEDLLKEHIDKISQSSNSPYAQKGAVVILDPNNGEVLTMANYPSYDPNIFIPYITTEDYNAILSDPLKPLTALAFQERYAPGSTFKPFVGLVALMENEVKINEEIYCHRRFTKYGTENAPACWVSNYHGWENLYNALKHSCDMYFYEVASRIGIDDLNKWADIFGLNSTTGLEIEETSSFIGSRERKSIDEYANIKYEIRYYLNEAGCITDETDSALISELVNELSALPANTSQSTVRNILVNKYGLFTDSGIPGSNVSDTKGLQEMVETIIYDVLVPRKNWMPGDTVRTGIGQAYVQLTPIGLARYTATIANGGKVMDCHLIKHITDNEGNIIYETPVTYTETGVYETYLNAVKQGMWAVCNDKSYSGGGNGSVSSTFPSQVKWGVTVAGKTGTAQTVGTDKKYNTAWFTCFAPYDNPEVVISVMLPNAYNSSNASSLALKIINLYFDYQNEDAATDTVADYAMP
ncbi:MAG: hypothetical protein E7315_01030 [Clostridiales bacterium]|nr:hypothetical protein [Clostridiales bacterium]